MILDVRGDVDGTSTREVKRSKKLRKGDEEGGNRRSTIW